VVFRPGGGVKYFVTPHIAHDELYRAVDFAVGAEFLL
jgi:hypothetical protein